MIQEGHIQLKRWGEPSNAPEDNIDLTEYRVYLDTISGQYKAKFFCSDCGKYLGVFCYSLSDGKQMINELIDGMYCVECYENSDFDINFEDCEHTLGRLCSY